MKIKTFAKSGIFLFLIGVLISCTKEENASNSYFVSKESKLTLTSSFINSFMDGAITYYPDISSLADFIINDVEVYKVTYRTTVNGESIIASGLVCVPSVPGEYPVISFQNGTNTRNAQAPSNYPIDPAYQLVEVIASMGYVVLIADYPGFGASSQIAHPYLVKEPTVQALVDLLYTVKEMAGTELPGISLKNEYFLLGYSQGGWATLALHKALELDYSADFNLAGTVCGAGPYNIYSLLQGIVLAPTYPMPIYFAYIVNAYKYYNQFTNPVGEIFNDPYAARLNGLFNGTNNFGTINSQLTPSIPGLLQADFISGFASAPKYSTVRDALTRNSIAGWKTNIPLYFVHGGSDTHVNPSATENIYNEMINAGTSPLICKKEVLPGLDHGEALVPGMIKGLLFILNL
jgi:pimeloyl-ACP methyl ester carboxylesterase